MLADIMLYVNGDLSDAARPMRQRKGAVRLPACRGRLTFVNVELAR